jgi:hypothetical protein
VERCREVRRGGSISGSDVVRFNAEVEKHLSATETEHAVTKAFVCVDDSDIEQGNINQIRLARCAGRSQFMP